MWVSHEMLLFLVDKIDPGARYSSGAGFCSPCYCAGSYAIER